MMFRTFEHKRTDPDKDQERPARLDATVRIQLGVRWLGHEHDNNTFPQIRATESCEWRPRARRAVCVLLDTQRQGESTRLHQPPTLLCLYSRDRVEGAV